MDMSSSFFQLRDLQSAIEYANKAKAEYTNLKQESNDTFSIEIALAGCKNQLAGCVQDKTQVVALLSEAISDVETLQTDPRFFGNLHNAQEVGTLYFNLANALHAVLKLPESLKRFGEAISIQQEVLEIEPRLSPVRYQLGASKNFRGKVLRKLKREKEAKTEISEAIEILRELADQNPKVPHYTLDLLAILMEEHFVQPPDLAEETLAHVVKRIESLVTATDSKNPLFMTIAGRVHRDFSLFLLRQKRDDDADAHFQSAKNHYLNAVKISPQSVEALVRIGELYVQHLEFFIEAKDYDKCQKIKEELSEVEKTLPKESILLASWKQKKSSFEEAFSKVKAERD